MIDFLRHFRKHNLEPQGVVHVGAHIGQEVPKYKAAGFEKILLIEANPEVYSILENKFINDSQVITACFAVSDNCNSVTLNIASGDAQSSSVLQMRKHLDYYPYIQNVGTRMVAGITLDLLFAKLGLQPADFNMLCIDVQGAEHLVLAGATDFVGNHVQSILLEVNNEELYEGCAMFSDIESHLSFYGFNRVEEIFPHHSSWGDALYVRKPLRAMTSLGSNGRFGNQLFQFLYLRLLDRQANCVIQCPNWIGYQIFNLKPYPPIRKHIKNLASEEHRLVQLGTEHLKIDPVEFLSKSGLIETDLDLIGYFQMHTKNLVKFKKIIHEEFSFQRSLHDECTNILKALNPENKKIIAIHLRRGDYGFGQYYRAPCRWYEDVVSKFDSSHLVYIASDEAETYLNRFDGKNVVSSVNHPRINPKMRFLFDFFVMCNSDYLLISNSSFSFFASLLNSKCHSTFRPSVLHECLVEYDAWDSTVIDPTIVGESQHQYFREID